MRSPRGAIRLDVSGGAACRRARGALPRRIRDADTLHIRRVLTRWMRRRPRHPRTLTAPPDRMDRLRSRRDTRERNRRSATGLWLATGGLGGGHWMLRGGRSAVGAASQTKTGRA